MDIIDKIISKKRNIYLFLILLTIISSITLFLIPNMSRGHDLIFHLSRISAIKDNMKLGIIGGYIYPNYLGGYGYGNPLFYPDIFLYIPAFLSYCGLSVIASYKIFLVLINFFSVFSMYISVKGISNNKKSAIISSILYGFASYRLVDMFTRAALGETLAFIFAPLVIYGIYEIIYKDYKKFYILVIGMSGLLLSHLISSYLMILILSVICMINIKQLLNEKQRIIYIIISALITILLVGYYIFPMLEQMISNKFWFNNLDTTSKLLERSLPIWSIFLEFPNHIFTKLWIPTGIGISFIIMIYYFIKNYKKINKFTKICFIIALVLILFSTNIFPWNLMQSLMSVIQFPWRLYFLATLLLSIGSGLLFNDIKIDINNKLKLLFITSFIPILSIGILNFFEANIKQVGEYDISFGEYMPINADKEYIERRKDVITSIYPLDHTFKRDGLNLEINIVNNQYNNKLELPLLYYKGYSATIGNKEIEVYETSNGLVGIDIDAMQNKKISVKYKGTKIQLASKIISLLSFIIFIITLIIGRGDKNEKKES